MKNSNNVEEYMEKTDTDIIIDKAINMSIISRLLKLKIIDEKQFYSLKNKIQSFY